MFCSQWEIKLKIRNKIFSEMKNGSFWVKFLWNAFSGNKSSWVFCCLFFVFFFFNSRLSVTDGSAYKNTSGPSWSELILTIFPSLGRDYNEYVASTYALFNLPWCVSCSEAYSWMNQIHLSYLRLCGCP